jgi:hypothetical protein
MAGPARRRRETERERRSIRSAESYLSATDDDVDAATTDPFLLFAGVVQVARQAIEALARAQSTTPSVVADRLGQELLDRTKAN